MNCHDLENYLTDEMAGEVRSARAEEFVVHIGDCPSCKSEHEAYQRQDEELKTFFAPHRERALNMRNPLATLQPVLAAEPTRRWRRALAIAATAVAGLGLAYAALAFLLDRSGQ